jgi:hypothetical protein
VLGQTETPKGRDEDFIATENAGSWLSKVAPLPAGGTQASNFGPNVLACTSAGNCVGTSVYMTATSVAADILVESAGAWSATAIAVPSNAAVSGSTWPAVASIACPSAGHCVIAGDYKTLSGFTEGLIVTQEGSKWVSAEAPTPGGAVNNRGASLAGVRCFSATSCVAVGEFHTATGAEEALLVADRSGTFGDATAPLPGNAAPSDPSALLSAVSCASSTTCVAFGDYKDSKGAQFGLIVTKSTSHWVAAPAPAPTGASTSSPGEAEFASACAAGFCVAVGQYRLATGKLGGLVLVEEGGRWSALSMPVLGGAPALPAVACSADQVCAAAGSYGSGPKLEGYLLLIDGTSLSAETSPLPPNHGADPLVDLGSVACPAAGTCVASGDYDESGSSTVQLPLVVSQ